MSRLDWVLSGRVLLEVPYLDAKDRFLSTRMGKGFVAIIVVLYLAFQVVLMRQLEGPIEFLAFFACFLAFPSAAIGVSIWTARQQKDKRLLFTDYGVAIYLKNTWRGFKFDRDYSWYWDDIGCFEIKMLPAFFPRTRGETLYYLYFCCGPNASDHWGTREPKTRMLAFAFDAETRVRIAEIMNERKIPRCS